MYTWTCKKIYIYNATLVCYLLKIDNASFIYNFKIDMTFMCHIH